MTKIPTKRMYDVIAELQSSSQTVDLDSMYSQWATTLVNLPSFTNTVTTTSTTTKKKSKCLSPESDGTVTQNIESNESSSSSLLQSSHNQHPLDTSSNGSHLDHVKESITNLRQVYMYGLQKVSELQDLQHAPDAILPGSIVLFENVTGE